MICRFVLSQAFTKFIRKCAVLSLITYFSTSSAIHIKCSSSFSFMPKWRARRVFSSSSSMRVSSTRVEPAICTLPRSPSSIAYTDTHTPHTLCIRRMRCSCVWTICPPFADFAHLACLYTLYIYIIHYRTIITKESGPIVSGRPCLK